jgi:protein tyrosine phosphatase (PTP) superfamily phosphohydrolase (DUF442 family)
MKFGLTLLLAIPFAFSTLAAQAASGIDPVLNGASSIVPNLRIVSPTKVYRGGHPGDAGIKALAQAGIKTIVDLQGGDWEHQPDGGESEAGRAEEKALAQSLGMSFFSIPLSSLKLDFDDQSSQINDALNLISDPAHFPVFVHCFHGQDRTGVVVALYRTTYQGCTADQAHREMVEDGHNAYLFWMDSFFFSNAESFLPLPGRSSRCPLP